MIERVRADETLAVIPALTVAMGGEHVEGIVADYQSRVGTPTVVEQLTMGNQDRNTLQRLFGGQDK